MKKLIGAAAAALALTVALAGGAQARAEARVVVTLAAQDVLTAPPALASGAHTVVLRNRGPVARRIGIVRVPGGVASLIRFEGLFFLPPSGRVVHDLGHVDAGRTRLVRVRIRPGQYLLASFEGSAVAAARPLTVGATAARAPAAVSPRLVLLPGSRVGRVAGTRAYVGLSFDGRRLRAYVCDGDGRPPTISQWLKGRWDGRSPLTLARNGIELSVGRVLADGSVAGRIRIGARSHTFRAATAKGAAGLYDGTDASEVVRVTWIVLADGGARGAMVDPRPRKCRPVQVTLADGTTQIATVCKVG